MIKVGNVKEGDTVTIWLEEHESKGLQPRKAKVVKKYPRFWLLEDERGLRHCPQKIDLFKMLNNLTESAYQKALRAAGR